MLNTQVVYRDLKSQTTLMRAVSEINRTIDPRQSKKFNFAQQTKINRYPNVKLLRQKLKLLLQTFRNQKRFIVSAKETFLYNHYRQAYQAYCNLKRQYKKVFLTKIKQRYKKEQSMIDIQQQLKKLLITEQKALQTAEYVFEKRAHAIDALFTFATSLIEEKYQQRITAINTLIALSKKQKSQNFRRRKADIKFKKKRTSISPPPNLSETLPIECKVTQCIFCLKNENLSTLDRLKTFASRDDLKKHFHRKHLRHHRDDQPIPCPHPRCDVILNGPMHLQNHAEVMHKTPT